MEPVDRKHHNHVYESPDPNVGDLSGYAVEGAFSSHWRPNSEELALLVEGGDIELTVFAQPIPPVSVTVIAGEDHSPLPSDPESQEIVELHGREWRVPPPVAQEVAALRENVAVALAEKISTIEIKPDDTVIITIPDDAGPEMTEGILAALSKQFPENRACVLPESLGLHARDKFVELLQAGAKMAENISADPVKAIEAAQEWRKLVEGE